METTQPARDGATQTARHEMKRDDIWKEFDRMQKAIMAGDSLTTKQEFFSEPESEQKRFYNWMCANCKTVAGRPWY